MVNLDIDEAIAYTKNITGAHTTRNNRNDETQHDIVDVLSTELANGTSQKPAIRARFRRAMH